MAKKNNAVEILTPIPPVPNVRAQIDAYIEQKISAMIGADFAGVLEPFFQRKAIAHEIRKLQTLPQQHKWSNCFKEWGCMDCKKKDGPYAGNGMCAPCYSKWKARLRTIVRFTEKERPDTPAFAPDRPDLARACADENAIFIAVGIPPIEAETRTYVTKAERRAQRNAVRDAQRQESSRPDNRQPRAEIRALHFKQGLTWKEIAQQRDPGAFAKDPAAAAEKLRKAALDRTSAGIAAARERRTRRAEILGQARNLRDRGWSWKAITQRLDPEGFAKDAAAAIVRMQVGVYRCVPLVRDLAELARTALAQKS